MADRQCNCLLSLVNANPFVVLLLAPVAQLISEPAPVDKASLIESSDGDSEPASVIRLCSNWPLVSFLILKQQPMAMIMTKIRRDPVVPKKRKISAGR